MNRITTRNLATKAAHEFQQRRHWSKVGKASRLTASAPRRRSKDGAEHRENDGLVIRPVSLNPSPKLTAKIDERRLGPPSPGFSPASSGLNQFVQPPS